MRPTWPRQTRSVGSGCARSWRNGDSDGWNGGTSATTPVHTSKTWKTSSSSHVCRPSFFHPVQLHLEPTDLLVQLGTLLLRGHRHFRPRGEHRFRAAEQLLLPP